MVRRTLNVGFAAQCVDAAAGDTHIAQQQLDYRHSADVLASHCMMRPTQGVAFRPRLVRHTGRTVDFINLQEVFFRYAGDAGNLVQCITGIMLLQHLEN